MVDIGKEQSAAERSPSVKYLLDGKSKINHIGEGSVLQRRNVKGREYSGSSHVYSVTLPKLENPSETWTTELTVWSPLPIENNRPVYERAPSFQLFLATGKGEMPFTEDPDVVNGIVKEIGRQMDEQRKAEEKAKSAQ